MDSSDSISISILVESYEDLGLLREDLREIGQGVDVRPQNVPRAERLGAEANRVTTHKGLDASVAALLVTTSLASVRILSKIIVSWIERQGQRKISIEVDGNRLDLDGVSARNQSAALTAWISKCSTPESSGNADSIQAAGD